MLQYGTQVGSQARVVIIGTVVALLVGTNSFAVFESGYEHRPVQLVWLHRHDLFRALLPNESRWG